MADPDDRLAALTRWIGELDGFASATLSLASGDASFRRYFRVSVGDRTYIAMDAPPPMEDCRPFVRVAGYLSAMTLNAPEIITGDPAQGFLLMTDFGTETYLDRLTRDSAAERPLYDDAIDALLVMQAAGRDYQSDLPPYDEGLLRTEMSLFRDWLCGTHLGLLFDDRETTAWQAACDFLVVSALAQPTVFVHRDYHSRNLMVTERRNPGIIDFQDAVAGPLTYDLASLLKDCYYRLDPSTVRERATGFFERQDAALHGNAGLDTFLRWFELTGVQRHLKAAGIFARLFHRDGKDGYLGDIPRTLGYVVEVAPRYAPLVPLAELINTRCLPGLDR